MLRRKMYDVLKEWKGRKHKSLVIEGQRQVGKTYIIERFAEAEYSHYVKFDFGKDRKMREAFSGNLDVDEIVNRLRVLGHVTIGEGNLIILDEVQDCPDAMASLKYFTIDGRYDVIATGSMLGVENFRLKKGSRPLAPIGYVEVVTMRALDFEEFLWAVGIGEDLIADVRTSIRERRPLSNAFLHEFTSCFYDYMIVGGMPESVSTFVESKDYSKSFDVIDDILVMCSNDINRYNDGINIERTKRCFESIPAQLSETNKKFTFTRITDGGGRKAFDTYGGNLLWIEYAGYGNFCRLLRSPTAPLSGQSIVDAFKVYLSDTGMLVRMYGESAEEAILRRNSSYNNGAIAENIVAECILKSGFKPFSYRKTNGEDKMELDFVVEMDGGIAVIEVKWSNGRSIASLKKAAAKFRVKRKIVLEDGNIHVDEEGIEHYPLFAVAFMDSMRQS